MDTPGTQLALSVCLGRGWPVQPQEALAFLPRHQLSAPSRQGEGQRQLCPCSGMPLGPGLASLSLPSTVASWEPLLPQGLCVCHTLCLEHLPRTPGSLRHRRVLTRVSLLRVPAPPNPALHLLPASSFLRWGRHPLCLFICSLRGTQSRDIGFVLGCVPGARADLAHRGVALAPRESLVLGAG